MDIYVYKDINDFLDQMECLNEEYNQIAYYYKCILDINEMNNQLNYIKKKQLLCFTGFYTKRMIKITIFDKGQKYCITYRLKHKRYYEIFIHELRKIELR